MKSELKIRKVSMRGESLPWVSRNWNDPRIDWKDPYIIKEWEWGGRIICPVCKAYKEEGHVDGCDLKRCAGCGLQDMVCECPLVT